MNDYVKVAMGIVGGILLLVFTTVIFANMTNHEVYAGYVGYVYRSPLFGGGQMFDRVITGPCKTGYVWRRDIIPLDVRLYKAVEKFEIRTADNLNVKIEVYGTFMPDAAKAQYIIETYGYKTSGGPQWYIKLVQPIFRSAVRETVNKYESGVVPSSRAEIAAAIKGSVAEFLMDKPVTLNSLVLSNVDYPASVDNEIQLKLAAIQKKERIKIEIEATKLEAEKRIAESIGIAKANEIIDASLTPSYIQFEAVKVAGQLAGSPNTTFYFVPVNGMGMPIVLPLPDAAKVQ